MSSSVVINSSSLEYIDDMMIDDTCKRIYNDIISIYRDIDSDNHDCEYDFSIAEKRFTEFLEKYNEHYLVYYFFGVFYDTSLKRIELAESCYKICISKYPLVDAYLNYAIIYFHRNDNDTVKKILNSGLIKKPTELRLLNFLGAIYYIEKDYTAAIKLYLEIIKNSNAKSLTMKNIYNNTGFSYSALGECETALKYFDDGLNMKFQNSMYNGYDLSSDIVTIDAQLLQNKLINYDYLYENPPDVFNDFLKINEIYRTVNICARKKSQNCKIKVGYVSPDLRHHVCAFFIDAVLKYFDRDIFDVYCYANVRDEDDISIRFKSYNGVKWFNIFEMKRDQICEMIHSHKIDVLIDLAGHTNGNNLDVFSKKPAPIQITYLGYPNSSGLTSMDYRITDKYADPPESKQKYSEILIRMPRCFICFTPFVQNECIDIPIKLKDPKKSIITFGVFNKTNKHNKRTFDVWSKIINSIPTSKLIIKRDEKCDFSIKLSQLKSYGLSDEQLVIANHIKDSGAYHELYNDIDICLDTFPYSGTTTSCDGLIMSTPIITLGIPNRHVSNVTASLLTNIGCPELIASSIDEYISKAIELANDKERLLFYKTTIRQKFIDLMNPKKFSNEFDTLIKQTFDNHID